MNYKASQGFQSYFKTNNKTPQAGFSVNEANSHLIKKGYMVSNTETNWMFPSQPYLANTDGTCLPAPTAAGGKIDGFITFSTNGLKPDGANAVSMYGAGYNILGYLLNNKQWSMYLPLSTTDYNTLNTTPADISTPLYWDFDNWCLTINNTLTSVYSEALPFTIGELIANMYIVNPPSPLSTPINPTSGLSYVIGKGVRVDC